MEKKALRGSLLLLLGSVIWGAAFVAQRVGISLGGTSIIIVVGVALETVRALEAQLLMRNYKGFLS